MPLKPLVIAVDFDGTCVASAWPDIGRDIGAAPVLRRLVDAGHKLILTTLRENHTTPHVVNRDLTIPARALLDEAVAWFQRNKIPLWSVNCHPHESPGTRKVGCDLLIDDTALGVPLRYDEKSERGYVNWEAVERLLMYKGVLQ